ncbi:ADP-heptose:LPS heptosyltransferase [Aliarcobacter butzleri 7h1h]|uniref:glycosyltransferase family 9 protein n=1 Tax=Aliarcobacter butzleri TaxID=28197 RepID=UPI0002F4C035|nr:glycosyltransferase family 9 protein [Aliarcobacter butzleri]AGR78013.1 ADP-heptose:LPS heptosyltransferase [Aliarcobacter butzleri 7h1h]
MIKKLILKLLLQKKYKEPINKKEINKILLVRNLKIGDAIVAFPLLRELKKNFPNAEIDIYASTNSDFLFNKLPYCTNVFIKFKKRYFYKTLKQIMLMKSRKYDLIIEAVPMRFGLEISIWYMKPKWVIGFGKSSGDQKLGISRNELSFYDKLAIEENNKHASEHMCSLLNLLDINNYSTKMEFPFDEEKYNYAQKFVSELPKREGIIALNVDASNNKSTLYKDQIINFSNYLKEYTLIIMSLPSRQKEINEIIKSEKLSNCVLSYTTKTIFDAAELIRCCDLLISPDTSFIHISSGINLPTIGIYYKNNFNYWGPKSDIKYVIKSDIDKKSHLIKNINFTQITEYIREIYLKKEKSNQTYLHKNIL